MDSDLGVSDIHHDSKHHHCYRRAKYTDLHAQSFATPTSDATDTNNDAPATVMSAGAKAGIAIGIVLASVFILGIFPFFGRRGQHQRMLLGHPDTKPKPALITYSKWHELNTPSNAHEMGEHTRENDLVEISQSQAHELTPDTSPYELSNDSNAHEVEQRAEGRDVPALSQGPGQDVAPFPQRHSREVLDETNKHASTSTVHEIGQHAGSRGVRGPMEANRKCGLLKASQKSELLSGMNCFLLQILHFRPSRGGSPR